ncbi:MAG: hypothetical protein U9R19_06775, partial [Bacteroidota bacterium]|nr:hypothetical protein [Bacteroidota bacterium]
MPKVKHNTLILITGFIWLTASMILSWRAYSWIGQITSIQLGIGIILALPLAFIKIYLIFRKLTLNNIKRIQSIKQTSISIWEFH